MSNQIYKQAGMLLRVLRLKAGVDQALLAARLEVSQPTISRYEKGTSLITAQQARQWVALCCDALPDGEQASAREAGRALERLLAAGSPGEQERAITAAAQAEHALVLDVGPARTAVPYYADSAARRGEPQEQLTQPRARLEVPAHLLELDPGCYALRVSGDSMAPLLLDGDIVVISPAAPLEPGCIVAAYVEPDGDVVKLYHPLPGGGAVLQPANPAYPPLVLGAGEGQGARVWGRVVFQQREL